MSAGQSNQFNRSGVYEHDTTTMSGHDEDERIKLKQNVELATFYSQNMNVEAITFHDKRISEIQKAKQTAENIK